MMWAGAIGSPIEHSLSPVIHRAAWEDLGIVGWEYRHIEYDGANLPEFISGLDESFRGLSVTMPCKQAIIPLLDVINPLTIGVGAVNTVVLSFGVLAGFSTDVTGIASATRRACSQVDRALPTSAVVLGARTTTSSALAALGELGIVTFTVTARRFGGPGSIVAASSRLGISTEQVLWSDRGAVLRAVNGADLMISTLPVGITDSPTEEMTVREGQVLLDVVYSPRETALRSAFERNGGIVAEGTDMLISQAVAQVRLMTGRSPKTDVMRDALEAELARRARASGEGAAS